MKLNYIITKRHYCQLASYDLVYEWENCIKKLLNLDYFFESKKISENKVLRNLHMVRNLFLPSKPSLGFVMTDLITCGRKSNILPCIIDFYIDTPQQISKFEKRYSKNPAVLISSKEAFDYLRDYGVRLNIKHWGLSISDQYAINPSTAFEKNTI